MAVLPTADRHWKAAILPAGLERRARPAGQASLSVGKDQIRGGISTRRLPRGRHWPTAARISEQPKRVPPALCSAAYPLPVFRVSCRCDETGGRITGQRGYSTAYRGDVGLAESGTTPVYWLPVRKCTTLASAGSMSPIT
jgi:hypothetical protein